MPVAGARSPGAPGPLPVREEVNYRVHGCVQYRVQFRVQKEPFLGFLLEEAFLGLRWGHELCP